MIRRPPRSTRTDTLLPSTTLFRSYRSDADVEVLLAAFPRGWIGRNRRQQRIAAFRFDQLRTAHPRIEAHQQPKQADRHRRSEEHTSELQSLMRTSYAVLVSKKTKYTQPTSPSITIYT